MSDICENNFDDEISLDSEPSGKRCDPLGAASNDQDYNLMQSKFEESFHVQPDENRLKNLEDEQEMLTSSLLALTSHFAQVQFRLRQIVESPPDERDVLLKKLEEFAFRGIPEIKTSSDSKSNGETTTDGNIINLVEKQKCRQNELIVQLKSQLEDLEKYAYESGEPVLPQSIIVQKQKIIIDELRNKINLNFNEIDLPQLSPEDLISQVDSALGALVSPLKMKEQLVTQLKTQIVDLERFITFLQDETKDSKMMAKAKAGYAKCECISDSGNNSKNHKINICPKHSDKTSKRCEEDEDSDEFNSFNSIIQKAGTLLQIFALTQMGCGARSQFEKNTLKTTNKGNHWGDIRAKLEVDIQEILSVVMSQNQSNRIVSDNKTNIELITIVRKHFAMTILKLIQHGLIGVRETTSLVPFIGGCFNHHQKRLKSSSNFDNDGSDESSNMEQQMHAWELILEYYHIKNGEKYNETPARKLSQSFNLELVGSTTFSNKQSLLSSIGSIIAIHSPYKKSLNTHFKAFICAGLNSGKLIPWLSLIFQCTDLVNTYYADWSYVSRTGFRDALRSLEKLTKYKFDLPVDLAIRQFQNIKDIF